MQSPARRITLATVLKLHVNRVLKSPKMAIFGDRAL